MRFGLPVVLLLGCTGLFTPNPFAGNVDLKVSLRGSGPMATHDAEVLRRRLQEVSVEGVLLPIGEDELSMSLSGVAGEQVIAPLIARRVLELRFSDGHVITNDEIKTASTEVTEFGPSVWVVLTPAGKEHLCEWSESSIGEKLEIRVDAEVVSTPVIQEKICVGKAQISMGGMRASEEMFVEATSLAISLRFEPLSSTWTVESVER